VRPHRGLRRHRRLVGELLPVTIYDCTAHTLIGQVVTGHVGPELFSLDVVPSAGRPGMTGHCRILEFPVEDDSG
jgi:hypothetical protein